ncbi:MOSC domain-containing protein [Streptomyces sp. NPDC057011]|uniref:MOSC domain-containing protein n=1 Tax=unclassified Streptomyces TaxID=2593676 RepID=UPI003637220B
MDAGALLGTVERIWRYPIMSTGGERLDTAAVDDRGLVGDRLYAVRDTEGRFGSGKNTRRFRRGYLGREDVEVAREGTVSHFDQLPLSLLTTATLDWVRAAVPGVPVDERRFRPNLLVRTPPGTRPFVEDDWFGGVARIGDDLRVRFERSSERCVMTNEAQRGLPHSPLVLRAIAREHGTRLDALATVARPGRIQVGDAVRMVGPPGPEGVAGD